MNRPMLCPTCGAVAKETRMKEEGTDYPIWVCTKDAFHWGGL